MSENHIFRHGIGNGIRLVGETVPGRRSVALGIWLRVGSRDEEPGREGLAHFIEHLVFKGTGRRSGREIAASLERVGGSLDAFTTKDTTAFYARVLEEHLETAADVLGDIVAHPRFAPADVELERGVVMEELRSVEDSPEELIGDLAMAHLWPDDIMGASILGTRESLAALDRGAVAAFHTREYRAPRVVVSAVGAVQEERLVALLERTLRLPTEAVPGRRRTPVPSSSTLALHESDLSQLYLTLVAPAPADTDPRRRAVHVLAEILGGGMSSRLFQSIREEAGLAYSIGSYTEHFEDVGMFGTSLAVSPKRGEEALTRTLQEMRRLVRDGLDPGELEGAKAQVRGSLIMGLESLTNRMSHLARTEFRREEHEPIEEAIRKYEAVSADEVMEAAREYLDPQGQNLIAVGPVNRNQLYFKDFERVVEARAS